MLAVQLQIETLLVHRTVGIVLIVTHNILFVVVFALIGELAPGSDFLVCQKLVVGFCLLITYYYYCLSDKQQWPCTKVEGAGYLVTIRLVDWQRQVTVSGIICMHVCHCV